LLINSENFSTTAGSPEVIRLLAIKPHDLLSKTSDQYFLQSIPVLFTGIR
jgi:hypothetical protein